MKVSIILPTNRVGGMDVLFAGLRAQNFREFELIVVDEIYEERRERFRFEIDRMSLDFPVIHRPPKDPPARWGNYMRSLNTAVEIARGSVLLFISDYTALEEGCISAHWWKHELARKAGMRAAVLGRSKHCRLPRLHSEFGHVYGWLAMDHRPEFRDGPTYAPWLDARKRHDFCIKWTKAYERDLESGRLDPFMWSTFDPPLSDLKPIWGSTSYHVEKGDLPEGEVQHQFFNLKNDSVSRSLIEEMGGFDERADGSHGHQDSITAKRLAAEGCRFLVEREASCIHFDPHGIAVIRRLDRPDDSNLGIYNS